MENSENGGGKESARDRVSLTHVEQKDKTKPEIPLDLQAQIKQAEASREKLNEDEFSAISAISENKRLFLVRIQLIVNQSRVPIGKPALKESEIRALMRGLVERGLVDEKTVTTEGLGPREVYTLTAKGKDFLL